MKKVAIVGGGAAALCAAVMTARAGLSVTLFEANDAVGKKILASGNGKCNISNQNISIDKYEGDDPYFASHALEAFDFQALEAFFYGLGLLFEIKPDGKAYPKSQEARSVVAVLEAHARNLGVSMVTHTPITEVKKKQTFTLKSATQTFDGFHAVLLATGLGAAPQLGSNESGLSIARALGHQCAPTYPVLVQLELEGHSFSKMQGVKLQGSITLIIDAMKQETFEGDVLFTAYGISGLAVLDASSRVSWALMHRLPVEISIALDVGMDREELFGFFYAMTRTANTLPAQLFLGGVVGKKVAQALLHEVGVEGSSPWGSMERKKLQALVQKMFDWRFTVKDTHGFKHAEASGGGVKTSHIDPKTMQSTLIEGLYFAGELIDIVGSRGGYNFHFAWASAYVAAQHMAQKLL